MKATIYANYGILAHELTPVYSADAPISNAFRKLIVEIPDELGAFRAAGDTLCLAPNGSDHGTRFSDATYDKDGVPTVFIGEKETPLTIIDVID